MADSGEARTIKTEALARVEGEGAMQIRIRDGQVESVEFHHRFRPTVVSR